MTKYRDILRMSSMGLSQRSIASSCQCSRNTVSEVLNRAMEKELAWPLPEDVADDDLHICCSPREHNDSAKRISPEVDGYGSPGIDRYNDQNSKKEQRK